MPSKPMFLGHKNASSQSQSEGLEVQSQAQQNKPFEPTHPSLPLPSTHKRPERLNQILNQNKTT